MNYIHSYSYKPKPRLHGHWKKHVLLGVELEVDYGGEDEYHARQVLTILNGDPSSKKNAYIKHDGSLDSGFEIVSQPATINYHIGRIKWKEAFEYLLNAGYKSASTHTCGLHVHFNCIFLGSSEKEFLEAEGKMLVFFEENWEKILRFSRRTQKQVNRYCRRYGHSNIKKAYEDNNESRYFAINFQNPATDEIRVFRGTLKYSTFIATLSFVHNLVIYCKKNKNNPDNSWESFLRFVSKHNSRNKHNETLIDYLKSRDLWTL